MAKTFNAVVRARCPKTLKTRLDRIASGRGKQPTEIYREALIQYADQNENGEKRKKAA